MEESKDQGSANKAPEVSAQSKVDEVIAAKYWLEELQKADSNASKMVTQCAQQFDKYQSPFINTIRQMLKSQDQLNASSLLGGESDIVFAIMLQNVMQPKNSNRTDAIKSNSYKELRTSEDALDFVNSLISQHFKNDLLSVETSCKNQIASLQQMQGVKLILEAPDVYLAAAVLIQ